MKRLYPVLLCSALLALPAGAEEAPPQQGPLDRLSVQVDVKPSSEKVGMYVATSEVTDLEGNRVLIRPKLLFSTRSPASIEMPLDNDDLVRIDIRISRDKQTADYQFRHTRGNKLLARQQLKLRLRA